MARLSPQIDCRIRRPKTGKFIKRTHVKAMRLLDKLTLATEDHPSKLPFNRYQGWLS